MEELHRLTLKWASDRGLLENGTAKTQALKLGSEFGELCGNLANNKGIKDDIGDCLVVCTILSNLYGDDLLVTLEIQPVIHTTPSVPTAMMYLGEIQDMVIKNNPLGFFMRNFIHQLEGIAKLRHTNLEESWNIAYQDIKDRKGYLNEHGNFIKEAT